MARELRVPAIVNCGDSIKQLKTGDEVTIDASYNIVYSGVVRELQRYELMEENLFEESSEYLMLRRLIRHISPLNLIDPHNRNFSPAGCSTYHDMMRYIHQKSIQKIIDLSTTYKHRRHLPVSRLETSIPLGIFIAEIDENLKPGAGSSRKEADVESIPMRALLSGLHESGMWCTKPLSVDIGSFMSSLTRTFSYSLSMPDEVGMNLALISEEYMNLNLRLGYHYTIIDALITDRSEENRISFRFFGGVTGFSRRSMRVKFIGTVLEKFDFRVELHGDLVVGRFKKASKSRMIGKMKIIGGLIGYTRQLDVQLGSERCLESCVEDFMNKIKSKMEVEGECYDPE
jgi:pyruvate,water dikinase